MTEGEVISKAAICSLRSALLEDTTETTTTSQQANGQFAITTASLLSALDDSDDEGNMGSRKPAAPGMASTKRIDEIKTVREERRFDQAASSMLDALSEVPAQKTQSSLFMENTNTQGPRGNGNFGKGLAVIDQCAIDVNKRELDHVTLSLADRAQLLRIKKTKSNEKQVPRKVQQRKNKAKQKGQSYAERLNNRAGPSRRKAKNHRVKMY